MLRRHAVELLTVLVLPALLQLGLAWLAVLAAGVGRQDLAWLALAGFWLGFALFATNCHRVVLGDAGAVRLLWGLRLDGRVFLYLAWSFFLVLVGALALVPALVMASMVLPALLPELDPQEQAVLLESIGWLFLVLVVHFLVRMSLVLPATALGRPSHPGESWFLTTGHGWRLTVGLCLPALAVQVLVEGLGQLRDALANPLAALVLALLAVLAGALTVVTLSCAWRLLGPDEEPPPDVLLP